ncbi:DNA polymerase family B-domain-containing protein [Halteromyces radiatus]|uniref:DNA polymerase family B-domain-containing protein n=1 Tax=Halteromyces radiatus TaxID=101107 RepID=UPI00221F29F5|nr:DNA polymerase family B-domain-containing protein [Halteromyces radiatus]KAI8093308.1 DNA polymerase family B-domain-containing protein [Halteromyces radiatus]
MSSPTSGRTRKRLVKGTEKVDKFQMLKDARRNRSRSALYDNKVVDDLYEEVDEEEYIARQDDDKFVEDDDNAGYIDDGRNDQIFSEDEYDGDADTGKRKRKSKSTKQQQKNKKVDSPLPSHSQMLNKFFQKSTKLETTSTKPNTSITEDDDFMANLLSNLGPSPEDTASSVSRKSRKIERSQRMTALNTPLPSRQRFAPPTPQPLTAQQQQQQQQQRQRTVNDHVNNTQINSDHETAEVTSDNHTHNNDHNVEDDADYGFDDMDLDFDDIEADLNSTTMKKKEVEIKMEQDEPILTTAPKVHIKKEETRDPDLQGWEAAEAKMTSDVMDTITLKEESTAMTLQEDDKSLHFWWYDAYEHRDKGSVYLFGKVLNKSSNNYISCCVAIHNIERNIFILPRAQTLDGQEVGLEDVYGELSDICTKTRIKKWASKATTRKYAFEIPGVPQEAEYLKMVYSYSEPALPENLSGNTFSHTFGIQTGPLEHFLIKRDIMGPCWLKIKDAKVSASKETWCKVEYTVNDPKLCNPLRDADGNSPNTIPPLVVMSLSLRTILNKQKNANEIVAASALVCKQVKIDEPTPIQDQAKIRFTAVRQLNNTPFPPGFQDAVTKERKQSNSSIQVERTESSLLNYLIARIHSCDPDVIVGHNFSGFDLDVLLHRMKALNTQHWHKLGRLKRKNWPKLQAGAGGARESTYQERMVMCGRLICDTYLASKDLIRSKSYRLGDLAKSQLKIDREDIEFDKLAGYYNNATDLLHLVKHCSFDAFLSSALMFKLQILPLTKQLTNLAGNLWARTMTGARAERNEFLLLHEFHRQKYICPDKSLNFKSQAAVEALEIDGDENAEKTKTKSKGRRKPAYSGGLVLEPKKGFYDKFVVLLDFNSLYPSIIQEYNICFTTVQREGTDNKDDEPDDMTEEKVPDIPDPSMTQGVLPRLIKALVERRRQVKKLMKDPKLTEAEMMQLDIRQKGLKLTANSMYGCLGFSHSRFYAKPLAMLITHKGREILQNTVNLAGSMDLNVIYGDTDSIMVYTNESELAKVKEMGNLLKKRVNELYNLLEIDIDGFFKHMLLLKKKKYAALLVEEKSNGELVETVETKGLDLVRRDWCDLSHDVSNCVLSFILSKLDREEVVEQIHEYLRQVGEQIRNGEMSLEKFIINKQLTKSPEEYADSKSQPHVQVALRMRQAGLSVNAGDTVPYVICHVENLPSGSKGFAERAFHPNDVKNGDKQLDIEWYLNQQVHPPIARLCSPINGTDAAQLAECLGLDGSKFTHVSMSSGADGDAYVTLDSQISDEERFKECDRLQLRCQQCQEITNFDGIGRLVDGDTMEYGLSCIQCHHVLPTPSVHTQLTMAIRKYIRQYYEGWLICDDDTCFNRTRMMSVFGRRCSADGCQGAMIREYTDKQLYTQLLFYSHSFDPELIRKQYMKSPHSVQISSFINKHHSSLITYRTAVDRYLNRSSYRHVDLHKLMSFFTI